MVWKQEAVLYMWDSNMGVMMMMVMMMMMMMIEVMMMKVMMMVSVESNSRE